MQDRISKQTVEALSAGDWLSDIEIKGFVARKLASGQVTYGFRYQDQNGRRQYVPLGLGGNMTAEQARTAAKKRTGEVADGRNPAAERIEKRAKHALTVAKVLDDFIEQYAKKLRSVGEYKRECEVYVKPRIGNISMYDLRRSHIVKMLDEIAKANGETMADRILAMIRKAFNWHAVRDERFISPIVKGMARTSPLDRARTRILDEQEIRDLWAALDALDDDVAMPKCFAPYVRTLLLTGQRRRMISNMTRSEISDDDCLIVPKERNKVGLDHIVPLTAHVLALIEGDSDPFVFSSDGGKTSFKGFSKAKAALDAKLAEIRKADGRKPMQPWVFHDLRRTARSLMSSTGVNDNVIERVLGHVLPGMRRVYDLYQYKKEKREALEKLAVLVNRILNPGKKVVAFPKKASR